MGRDFQFVQAAWPVTGPGFSALLSPAVKKVVCKSELRQPFLTCLAFFHQSKFILYIERIASHYLCVELALEHGK